MNFLSPDDIFGNVRRKSLCNGALLTLTSKGSAEANSVNATPSKSSKKERRRGSFNEQSVANNGRRASLVSRWFKHISDAAEQYKPRSKNANANQEPIDDPAISTIPHSNTRESLEPTPERPPPMSATATVTTTPLAPMMPLPMASVSVTIARGSNNNNNEVQLRSGRREDIPAGTFADEGSQKQQLSPTSVNRTMSTRSCGDASNNNISNAGDGVTLRHTQSAREASVASNENSAAAQDSGASTSASSNRNSTSIVTSNNSNNTRTLMQATPPLVEPSAIQISISPAHTAEPVLTPAERLRRLDASIRDGLLEKQRIICDMFRLPIEHFHEIIDIAAMPEAPKDSSDIALAAYAQVQSLTEVLNEYMIATPEQQVSAVSTSVCDHCHEKQRKHAASVSATSTASTSTTSSAAVTTQIDIPPPLPPPNKQQQAQQQTPAPTATKLQTSSLLDSADIHEDDDGYCEIDELRLPALPPLTAAKAKAATTLPSTPATPTVTTEATDAPSTASAANAELVERHSTISNADSIVEETAEDVKQNMDKSKPDNGEAQSDAQKKVEEKTSVGESESVKQTTEVEATTTSTIEESQPTSREDTPESSTSEPSDFTDALSTMNKLNTTPSMVDGTTQTLLQPLYINTHGTNSSIVRDNACGGTMFPLCGPNRIQHVNSLEPSVPCHALNGIVSALNAHISLLLPKISERDMERDRLRKENQHLRELLSAMHERQRVEDKLETPTDVPNTSTSAAVSTATDAPDDDETADDGAAKDNSTTVTTDEAEA